MSDGRGGPAGVPDPPGADAPWLDSERHGFVCSGACRQRGARGCSGLCSGLCASEPGDPDTRPLALRVDPALRVWAWSVEDAANASHRLNHPVWSLRQEWQRLGRPTVPSGDPLTAAQVRENARWMEMACARAAGPP